MKRRILSMVMAIVIMVSVAPVHVKADMTLKDLQSKFPHDRYWNCMPNHGTNNENGTTSIPCNNHNNSNVSGCNAFTANTNFEYSYQCMGFAEKCGFDATGSNPRSNGNWNTSYDRSSMNNLKAGDILRYDTGSYATDRGHSIYITAISGDTVTFGDCNWSNTCRIRWGVTASKAALTSNTNIPLT